MTFRPLRAAPAVVLAAIAALAAGCPDPEATFDEFGERYDQVAPDQGSTSTGPVEGCQVPEPAGPADGKYLFALSAGQVVAEVPANLLPQHALLIFVYRMDSAHYRERVTHLVRQPLEQARIGRIGLTLAHEPAT